MAALSFRHPRTSSDEAVSSRRISCLLVRASRRVMWVTCDHDQLRTEREAKVTVGQVGVTSGPDGLVDEVRTSTLAVVCLWLIAALGFVPTVVFVVLAPGLLSFVSLAVGTMWAAGATALTRPFVAISANGITYRSFRRAVHVPWAEIERFLVVFEEMPKVALLRRGDTLETVSVFSGVRTATATKRLRSLVESAARFHVEVSRPVPHAGNADEPITLERSRGVTWFVRTAPLLAVVAMVILLLTGQPFLFPAVVGMMVPTISVLLQGSPGVLPVKSMRFETTGVTTTQTLWPRRYDTVLLSGDIERIVMEDGIQGPHLVIMRKDHMIVAMPRLLLGGRDRVELHALAAKLSALAASPTQ